MYVCCECMGWWLIVRMLCAYVWEFASQPISLTASPPLRFGTPVQFVVTCASQKGSVRKPNVLHENVFPCAAADFSVTEYKVPRNAVGPQFAHLEVRRLCSNSSGTSARMGSRWVWCEQLAVGGLNLQMEETVDAGYTYVIHPINIGVGLLLRNVRWLRLHGESIWDAFHSCVRFVFCVCFIHSPPSLSLCVWIQWLYMCIGSPDAWERDSGGSGSSQGRSQPRKVCRMRSFPLGGKHGTDLVG